MNVNNIKAIYTQWLEAVTEFTSTRAIMPFANATIQTTGQLDEEYSLGDRIVGRAKSNPTTMAAQMNVAESAAKMAGHSQTKTPEASAYIEKVLHGGSFPENLSQASRVMLRNAVEAGVVDMDTANEHWRTIKEAISERRHQLGFEGPGG